jgi:hypothetical protein
MLGGVASLLSDCGRIGFAMKTSNSEMQNVFICLFMEGLLMLKYW